MYHVVTSLPSEIDGDCQITSGDSANLTFFNSATGETIRTFCVIAVSRLRALSISRLDL